MTTWTWLKIAERCGYCGQEIPEGCAALMIEIHGVTRRRYRGECCGGQAPPSMPSRPELASIEQRISQIAMQPIQSAIPARTRGSLKQMAREYLPYKDSRDPGEDG